MESALAVLLCSVELSHLRVVPGWIDVVQMIVMAYVDVAVDVDVAAAAVVVDLILE